MLGKLCQNNTDTKHYQLYIWYLVYLTFTRMCSSLVHECVARVITVFRLFNFLFYFKELLLYITCTFQ